MQCVRYARVNDREIPVVISDEREALLAAKAAGRAIIGVWREMPGDAKSRTEKEQETGKEKPETGRRKIGDGEEKTDPFDVSAAPCAVLSVDAIDERLLERAARRHLGLPWRICETERLGIREMAWDDFDEIWELPAGQGFGTPEELEAYMKNQYAFYEYGFWALIEKESGRFVGLAGFAAPRQEEAEPSRILYRGNPSAEAMELGYYIVPACRRKGYAKESCLAVMEYAKEEWGVRDFFVRIRPENAASLSLAAKLGFREAPRPDAALSRPVIKKEFQ